jgi:hypothetical protein
MAMPLRCGVHFAGGRSLGCGKVCWQIVIDFYRRHAGQSSCLLFSKERQILVIVSKVYFA